MSLKKLRKFGNKYLIYLILCLFNNVILSEGFLSGTLIKTPDNYKRIDELQENDFVVSYSFKEKILVDAKIRQIKKNHYKSCFKLTISEIEIIVAPDHRFYCPLKENSNWVKAKDLTKGDFVSSNLTLCIRIDRVEELNQESDFYCLSIDKYQNFFVSDKNIFVHNFVWWIPVFEIVIGGGFKLLLGASSIISAIAGILIVNFAQKNGVETSGLGNSYNAETNRFNEEFINKKFFKEVEDLTKDKKDHIFNNDQGKIHGFTGGPNDQDPEKWWEIIKRRLKKAYSRGEIRDGQKYEVRRRQNINPDFGDLIIRGVVQSGIIRVGTAFLEKQ